MMETQKVKSQFQKLFEFERRHDWRLPKFVYNTPQFQIEELQAMKVELNRVKGKLNGFKLEEWTKHTKSRDPAGLVISKVREKISPELLTQAWCKFYEILCTFPVVQFHEDFCSLHLCEAPGAFICALNHYLVLNYPEVDWRWQANTLNPDYEGNNACRMIADDRLIFWTKDNWLWGADMTGDILNYNNHKDILENAHKANLVTSDGSIDCMSDPGEQEKLVEFLQYCETMTALAKLTQGGCFVLKIFTIFEQSTICLLYLLSCLFNKIYLFKPCTSKSGNSELYVVCHCFNGFDQVSPLWDQLIQPYKTGKFDGSLSMFSLDQIPKSFIDSVKTACADFFLEKQIKTINDNVYFFFHPEEDDHEANYKMQLKIAFKYLNKFMLNRIPHNCKLAPNTSYKRINDLAKTPAYNKISIRSNSRIEILKGKRIDAIGNSKFTHQEFLLKGRGFANKPKELFRLTTKLLTTCTIISNFELHPYYKYQRNLFDALFDGLNNQKHIVIVNLPLHTSFLASLFLILGSTYESVHFGPGWCLFYKLLTNKFEEVAGIFQSIQDGYNNIHEDSFNDILSIIPSELFYTKYKFVPPVLRVYNSFRIALI